MAKAPKPPIPDIDRAAIQAMFALLRDVAESEHRLRHPEAFADMCAALAFEMVVEPHRTTVADPLEDTGEDQ